VRAAGERGDFIQEPLGPLKHLVAAHGIVAAPAGRAARFGYGIGAVQRIVEAAPTGVGRIQRIARVGHRYHELGAGNARYLVVHVLGVDGKVVPLLNQISDRAEKSPVRRKVEGFAFAGTMPFVDPRLQNIALDQQRTILGGEIVNDAIESGPETGFRYACTREDFPVDEVVKNPGDAEPFNDDAIGHALCCSAWLSLAVAHPLPWSSIASSRTPFI
jgi:hypothetical protein